MFKYLASAVVAASLFAAPMLATSAEAAQTVKIVTTQPAKVVIVKHKRFTRFHGTHVKHVRVWHPSKHHRHGRIVIVKKPTKVVVKKTIITR
jgi:hypothetical protein